MKNKTKFTKGEWNFEVTDKIGVYAGKKCISLIAMPHYTNTDGCNISKKEALANVKLIAAAPELLKNCNWCLNNFRDIIPICTTEELEEILPILIKSLDDVIHKATK